MGVRQKQDSRNIVIPSELAYRTGVVTPLKLHPSRNVSRFGSHLSLKNVSPTSEIYQNEGNRDEEREKRGGERRGKKKKGVYLQTLSQRPSPRSSRRRLSTFCCEDPHNGEGE